MDENRYKEYTTYLRHLTYREPNELELKYLKHYNHISCGVMGGITLFLSAGIAYLMYIKDSPLYAYIVPAVLILYALKEFFHFFFSKYGVWDGIVVEKYKGSKGSNLVRMWSKRESQYCPSIRWKGTSWSQIREGDNAFVYKINREYFAEFPIKRKGE